MRYAVPHAVIKMSFQDDLSDFVQGIFGRINLDQHILTRDIPVHHGVNGVNLACDFFQSAVQIAGIHALFHQRFPYGLKLPPFRRKLSAELR